MVFGHACWQAATFPDGHPVGKWYSTGSTPSVLDAHSRISGVVRLCARRRTGVSLFLSAVMSGKVAMIRVVAEGIRALVPEPEVRQASKAVREARPCLGWWGS